MKTKDETALIMAIVKRAEEEKLLFSDRLTLIMDIEAVHKEVKLGLAELLEADEFNFAHDIIGIQKNIDRKTKKLTNFFLPRYARG